jgi:hypothetical protein
MNQIRDFLRSLQRQVTEYYDDRTDPAGCFARAVNYEDLAYLAVQISETINRERDNPAISSFVRDISQELCVSPSTLRELADETVGLVADHVANCVAGLPPSANHLQCVRDAYIAARAQAIPILSLNHDCLIEGAFRAANVAFNDMTRAEGDGRRIVQASPSTTGVNLFKLHGSVDWFRWRPLKSMAADRFWGEWVGALDTGPDQSVWRHDSRPLLLVGRFNKELSYADSPFAEIFAHARLALGKVTVLVISGYSFGDKAVNTMLIDWMYGNSKGSRRIVVAHENPAELQRAARGAIGRRWESWVSAGVLVPIPTYLGDLDWSDLQGVVTS